MDLNTEPSCIHVLLSQRVLLSVGTETCSSEEEPLGGALQPELGKKSLFPQINTLVQQLLSLYDLFLPPLVHRYFTLS